MQKRIGLAGMGVMGSRMARDLSRKGFPLTVWNRTPERCEPLAAEDGVPPAARDRHPAGAGVGFSRRHCAFPPALRYHHTRP
jgi:3-hydroxyisobutyrate dehydrogenase-like beta-hydroxyacid dehydrogenase